MSTKEIQAAIGKRQALRNHIMKNIILIITLVIGLSGCTDNERARSFGGTETVNLPKGQRLVNATWKETDLWYLTEPMPTGYVPQTKTFHEKSTYGAWEGTVIFHESAFTVEPVQSATEPSELENIIKYNSNN